MRSRTRVAVVAAAVVADILVVVEVLVAVVVAVEFIVSFIAGKTGFFCIARMVGFAFAFASRIVGLPFLVVVLVMLVLRFALMTFEP